MSKRADKIAGRMVNQIMVRQPVLAKSAGTRQHLTGVVMPAAVVIAELEKAVKRRGKDLDRMTRRMAAMTERMSGVLAGHPVPGVTEVAARSERGWRQFDPAADLVGLVPKQAPKATNGHHLTEGVASSPPPLWHPEADQGGM